MHLELRARLASCALANTPQTVRVVRIRKSLSGCAHTHPKDPNFGVLEAPKPLTRRSLHVYLHECAHFALRHGENSKTRYLEELECEQWATAKMREARIAVPRKALQSAKAHVGRAIGKALERGAKRIDKRAEAFAKSFSLLHE